MVTSDSAPAGSGFYDAIDHTYWWTYPDGRQEEWPGVTSILVSGGLIDRRWYAAGAADRGRLVHRVCELHDRLAGELSDSLRAHLTAQLEAWRAAHAELQPLETAYLRFRDACRPQWTAIEEGRFHPRGRYGGRIDRMGLVSDDAALVEIKTGAEQSWHGVQLAGYQALMPTGSRLVVYLKPSGRFKLRRRADPDDYAHFERARVDAWTQRTTEHLRRRPR